MWHEGPIPPELSIYPGYLLARLGQVSAARFHAALAPENLHPRHFGVMSILAAQPGITQQRLAECAAIDTSSMVAVIDELEERGFAERRPNPDDRRARAIFLTPAATVTLERLRKRAGALQRELFAALSEQERKTLHELLRKLATARSTTTSGAAT
ncbi:MAG TPA: MarR family transcriptional regulator [Solirubrobacteraceae bacterium]|nr:MarR family transcriptional regulator [Solirubrobacteraceae bacterium]